MEEVGKGRQEEEEEEVVFSLTSIKFNCKLNRKYKVLPWFLRHPIYTASAAWVPH